MDCFNLPLGADVKNAPWNGYNKENEFGGETMARLHENIDKFKECFAQYLVDEHIDAFDWETYNDLTQEVYLMLPKQKRDELESCYISDLFYTVLDEVDEEHNEY